MVPNLVHFRALRLIRRFLRTLALHQSVSQYVMLDPWCIDASVRLDSCSFIVHVPVLEEGHCSPGGSVDVVNK